MKKVKKTKKPPVKRPIQKAGYVDDLLWAIKNSVFSSMLDSGSARFAYATVGADGRWSTTEVSKKGVNCLIVKIGPDWLVPPSKRVPKK